MVCAEVAEHRASLSHASKEEAKLNKKERKEKHHGLLVFR